MIKMKRKLSDFILSLLVLLAGIIVFIPFMYMFSSSMRTPAEAFKLPPAILPERFMIENYIQLFKSDLPFAKMFLNSTIVTGITIVIQIVVCSILCLCKNQIRWQEFLVYGFPDVHDDSGSGNNYSCLHDDE